MSNRQIERIRKVRPTAADAVAVKQSVPPPEKKPDDLNDVAVQEQIQNPTSREVTIGGTPMLLHTLPALAARSFTGLVYQIMSESAGGRPSASPGNWIARLNGTIVESPHYMRKLSEYTARATFPTAAPPTEAQLGVEADRIFNALTFVEATAVFDAMSLLNEVGKAISGKK